ncbi:MAG: Rrf2 family transcriptional regulator [Silicimonas sp.]|nr:Rrf2 family transcriptional regulator [Silicimonas sp.]
MRLTNFSDLSFRVLLYAAAHPDRLVTIDEMNAFYEVSRGHLMKVVNGLTRSGFLASTRGRSGGVKLARKPSDINLAAVLRATEPDFRLVECMRPDNRCAITAGCKLKSPMFEAMAAFLETIGAYSLADIQLGSSAFAR